MVRYSFIGATGYVCGELLRMMVNHPQAELVSVLDTFAVGSKIQESHPALRGFYDKEIVEPVSYTHLDVYKRQALNNHCQAKRLAP